MATKTQSKKSARSSVRASAPPNLWTSNAPPLRFGREEFRFRLYRTARRLPALDIDPWVEHATWGREGGTRTGGLNFRRPLGKHTASLIANGDEVRCDVALWGASGGWKTLWKLRVDTPDHQIYEGIISLSLSSALNPLTRSKVAWRFRQGKARPHGWDARQVTLNAAKRFNVKVRSLPKAKYRFARLINKSASPYDIIVRAWTLERQHTGRRFDIDISSGAIDVTELREPRYMLLLGPAITDAVVKQSFAGIASAITATATRKAQGHKKAKKLRVKVVDAARRRRYGYIVKTAHAPRGITSLAELRKWAKDRLAHSYHAKKTVSFTHPGLPFVDRGDALRFYLPEADLEQIVFVSTARHDLSAGSYTMDVTISYDDPWRVDQRQARAQRKKDAAAARRGRKGSAKATPRTPKKAASRSNH